MAKGICFASYYRVQMSKLQGIIWCWKASYPRVRLMLMNTGCRLSYLLGHCKHAKYLCRNQKKGKDPMESFTPWCVEILNSRQGQLEDFAQTRLKELAWREAWSHEYLQNPLIGCHSKLDADLQSDNVYVTVEKYSKHFWKKKAVPEQWAFESLMHPIRPMTWPPSSKYFRF